MTSREAAKDNAAMIVNNFNNPQIIRKRRFLLADLPAPLTRASEHLQFFDNYLTGTRLFLRQVRTPQTKAWTRKFVQQHALESSDLSKLTMTEIELNEYEYEVLSVFEGNELRFNRYYGEFENRAWEIDMYLNRELWNMILGAVKFDSDEEMLEFTPPDFIVQEITQDKFFTGLNLANATLEEVKKRIRQAKD